MAKQTGKSVAEVTTSGAGLAFLTYPEGIYKLSLSPVYLSQGPLTRKDHVTTAAAHVTQGAFRIRWKNARTRLFAPHQGEILTFPLRTRAYAWSEILGRRLFLHAGLHRPRIPDESSHRFYCEFGLHFIVPQGPLRMYPLLLTFAFPL